MEQRVEVLEDVKILKCEGDVKNLLTNFGFKENFGQNILTDLKKLSKIWKERRSLCYLLFA